MVPSGSSTGMSGGNVASSLEWCVFLLVDGTTFMEVIDGPETLQNADEIFLTNAIRGIRWISQFKERQLYNVTAKSLYQRYLQ